MAVHKFSLTLCRVVFPLPLLPKAHTSGSHFRKWENTSDQSELSSVTNYWFSSSKKNVFFDWCVFSPKIPLENSAAEPTEHAQTELWLPGQQPAGCQELCRKLLLSIQQQLLAMMLAVSGCPVATPRNYI